MAKTYLSAGKSAAQNGGDGMRMDHPIGLGEEDARRCCKRARQPVLDKRTGKDGTPARYPSTRAEHKEDR
jgi:hypothetical protein